MTDTLKIACVGAGYFSRFQYDAWDRNPRTEVVAAANRSVEKLKDMGIESAHSNIQDMLNSCDPDILDIITPPETHLDAIKLGIAKGVKLIICQKPFCMSLKEAEEAVALGKASGIPIVVHENFRFQPWFRTIKKSIDAGDIGDVLQFTFRMRTGDGQGPDAYMDRQPYFQTMPRLLIHETGVHYVDTFRYLLGPTRAIYADLRRMNPVIAGEDSGYVVFDYSDGRRAIYDGNRLLDHATEHGRITFGEALVEGTDGTLTLDGNGEVKLRAFGTTDYKTLLYPQKWTGFAGDCVYALQEHVVAGMLDGAEFENLAEDYLTVIQIEELIYQSSETGQKLKV